jgi:hypothetical protein
MNKVILHPRYQHLQAYIEAIPATFDSLGNVLYNKRNVVREDTFEGVRMVIKSFKRIYLPNKIRYTYWHPSKAARAYANAILLLDNGFNTPAPIAYIEVTKNGLLREMYFVCEYTALQSLQAIKDFSEEETKKILLDFTRFTFRLHTQSIYHIDYNISNILFEKINDTYVFSLIDNNRMGFGRVDFNKGLKNFRLLKLTDAQRALIGKEYARLWRVDETLGAEKLIALSTSEASQRKFRKSFKKLLKPFKRKKN